MTTINTTTSVGPPNTFGTLANNLNSLGGGVNNVTNTASSYLNSAVNNAANQLAGGYNAAVSGIPGATQTNFTMGVPTTGGYNATSSTISPTVQYSTVPMTGMPVNTGATSTQYNIPGTTTITTSGFGGSGSGFAVPIQPAVSGSTASNHGSVLMDLNTNPYAGGNTGAFGMTPNATSGIQVNTSYVPTSMTTPAVGTTITTGPGLAFQNNSATTPAMVTTNYSSGMMPTTNITTTTSTYRGNDILNANYNNATMTQPLVTVNQTYPATSGSSAIGNVGTAIIAGATDGKYILSTAKVPSSANLNGNMYNYSASHPATYAAINRVETIADTSNQRNYVIPNRPPQSICSPLKIICSLLSILGLLTLLWFLLRKPKVTPNIVAKPFNPYAQALSNMTSETALQQKNGYIVFATGPNTTTVTTTTTPPPITPNPVIIQTPPRQPSVVIVTQPATTSNTTTTTITQPQFVTVKEPQISTVQTVTQPQTLTAQTTGQHQIITTKEITTTQQAPGPIYITYSATMPAGLQKIYNPKTQTYIFINNFPPGSEGYIQKFGTTLANSGTLASLISSAPSRTQQTTSTYSTPTVAYSTQTAANAANYGTSGYYTYPNGINYSVQIPTSYQTVNAGTFTNRSLDEKLTSIQQTANDSLL